MLDLFDAPALPGLTTRHDLISLAEERMLIDRIDATDLAPSGSRAGPASD